MVNKLGIGDIVASSMQQIIQSDKHNKTFFKKTAADKCCMCKSCDKNCTCKECSKERKACSNESLHKDNSHVHDSNCVHDKNSAVNEMIELLSKISSVQDDLGLVESSVYTMKALSKMVFELKKHAQEDINDVRWDELVEAIKKDPDTHAEFRKTELLDPEIMALLRRRIQESDPSGFEEGVSADAASDYPLPEEFELDSGSLSSDPSSVIEPPYSQDLPTWSPDASSGDTELPPISLERGYVPSTPKLPGGFENDSLFPLENDQQGIPTIPVPKGASYKLDEFIKRYAQEDIDFEEEEDSDLKELFRLDEMKADDMWAKDVPSYGSDLDEELESGNFLALPEDGDSGFNYSGPAETYPGRDIERYRPSELIRMPGGSQKEFKDLSPEEQLELEMGADLHEQLGIDPDELSDQDVYPEEFYDFEEDTWGRSARNDWDDPEQIRKIRESTIYDDDDSSNEEKEKYRFWND